MAPFDGQIENFTREPNETKPLTEVQKVLLRAAERCEVIGWMQNPLSNYSRADAPNCALGHIMRASVEIAGKEKYEAATALLIHVGRAIAAWNDEGGRTKEEVIAALRSAASGREGK